MKGTRLGGASGAVLQDSHSQIKRRKTMKPNLLKVAGQNGWGGTLYPSGHFCLWRKNGQKTVGFKETFVAVGSWRLAGKTLQKVQQMYGAKTVRYWWECAAQVDVPGVRQDPAEAVDAMVTLGSSTPGNSEKSRRGLGGLTSRGKNLVREAATALESSYGKDRLTFWTLTLPSMSHEDYQNVCTNWARICENLKKKLIYHLSLAGNPPAVVGVTEMQEERWERDRVPAWHLHLVFVGKRSTGGWVLTPKKADKLWCDAVSEYTSVRYQFRSASQLKRVKKSVAGYLSKYLSKGSSTIASVEAEWPGCTPASWYICTRCLRRWVDRYTQKGDAIARWLLHVISHYAPELKGLWAYRTKTREGYELAVCWMGRLAAPPPEKESFRDYVIRMT